MSEEKKFYVRKASGLVREVSGGDVLFYNIFMINLAYVLYLVFSWVGYPGSSQEWAILLCIVGGTATTIVYGFYSIIFPRSGAEYVYLTRSLPPVLGFLFSWNSTIWLIWFVGSNSAMVSFGALSPLLTGMGMLTGSEGLLSAALWTESAIGIFIIGTLVILFFGGLLILGMKAYFNFQKIAFVISIIGILMGILAMAITSQETFIARFNDFMGAFTDEADAYHTIINIAQQEGYVWAPPSVLQTLKLSIWVYLAMGYCVLSSSFAGEIKNVKRSQPLGMSMGVIIAGIIFIAWTTLSAKAFGADFIRAISYLDMNAPQASIFPTVPWLSIFAGIAAPNIALSVLVLIGFFFMSLLLPAVCLVYSSRAILAWSIDRLTPDKLGEVSPRYHSPVNTILVVCIGAIIFNFFYAFAGDTPILVNALMWGIFAMTFSFGATTLVGAFFPYIRKHFYKGSPAEINIAGIPLMTIAGIIASIYIGSMIYWFATEPYVGTNSPEAIGFIILVFVIGLIFYYAFKWWRRKQGLDVDLAYKEIPIE